MKNIYIFLLFFVSACSFNSRQEFENRVFGWIGQPEEAIVAKLGPPKRFYELKGKRYLTFGSSSTGYVPQSVNSYVIGNSVQTNSFGGYSVNRWCYATYVVENGIITSASWEGNNCY